MQTNLLTSNLAELQVTYKTKVKSADRSKITSSKTAEDVFRNIWSDSLELREEFYLLILNRANQVMGWYRISQGGISGTVVDLKIIFAIALKGLASGIVIAHNHPSGQLIPSEADRSITQKIKEAGKLMDITLLDHLIITPDTYYSFADEGLL